MAAEPERHRQLGRARLEARDAGRAVQAVIIRLRAALLRHRPHDPRLVARAQRRPHEAGALDARVIDLAVLNAQPRQAPPVHRHRAQPILAGPHLERCARARHQRQARRRHESAPACRSARRCRRARRRRRPACANSASAARSLEIASNGRDGTCPAASIWRWRASVFNSRSTSATTARRSRAGQLHRRPQKDRFRRARSRAGRLGSAPASSRSRATPVPRSDRVRPAASRARGSCSACAPNMQPAKRENACIDASACACPR